VKPTTVAAALAAAVAVAVVFDISTAGQGMPAPRLGTGAVMVEGDVSVKGDVRVVNDVGVAARQSGPWKVGVDGVLATAPQTPPFVQVGRSYEVRWAGDVTLTVVVRETFGSWVRVDTSEGGRIRNRWINLEAAWWVDDERARAQARR